MTLNGSDYLLRLSGLAMAFVGFAAVVVTVRRALGAELSPLHTYFVRLFIEGGLFVAALGVLPAALSFTGLSEVVIWRVSSAAAALLFSVYLIFLFRRRRRITHGKLPVQTIIDFVSMIIATLALWANTIGIGFQPNAAPYVLALTWFLIMGGWVFLQTINIFILQSSSK